MRLASRPQNLAQIEVVAGGAWRQLHRAAMARFGLFEIAAFTERGPKTVENFGVVGFDIGGGGQCQRRFLRIAIQKMHHAQQMRSARRVGQRFQDLPTQRGGILEAALIVAREGLFENFLEFRSFAQTPRHVRQQWLPSVNPILRPLIKRKPGA